MGAELDTGTLTFALVDSAAHRLEFRPDNHPIALHVEAARATLESRGVRSTSDTIDSGVRHQIS